MSVRATEHSMIYFWETCIELHYKVALKFQYCYERQFYVGSSCRQQEHLKACSQSKDGQSFESFLLNEKPCDHPLSYRILKVTLGLWSEYRKNISNEDWRCRRASKQFAIKLVCLWGSLSLLLYKDSRPKILGYTMWKVTVGISMGSEGLQTLRFGKTVLNGEKPDIFLGPPTKQIQKTLPSQGSSHSWVLLRFLQTQEVY